MIPWLKVGAVALPILVLLLWHHGLVEAAEKRGEAKIKAQWQEAYNKRLVHAAALQTDLNKNAVTIDQVRIKKVSDVRVALDAGVKSIEGSTDADEAYNFARDSIRRVRVEGGLAVSDLA